MTQSQQASGDNSTAIDNVKYDIYLQQLTNNSAEITSIDKYREDILKRYYSKYPDIFMNAQTVNNEAIELFKARHYTASTVFSFSAIEMLTKEVVVRPLLHGNVIDESIADYITEELLKNMKNYSQYSKLFTRFINSYTKIDIKNFKDSNLLKEFDSLQTTRNNILHKGAVVDRKMAIKANRISRLYYEVTAAVMNSLGLTIDKKTWKIKLKTESAK